MNAVRALLPG
ncbi:MAG: Response regulator receiver domain [Porphyrobacter sp. HL-46]|nr:MAG: Response regulator receiver domain [Porphyrobacter sp. HL-46]